jgi:hypothetical protein
MSYQPIENYGIIGNMRTVALVGMNGSIDWYCYPHFDSPSIFGAILDVGGRGTCPNPAADRVAARRTAMAHLRSTCCNAQDHNYSCFQTDDIRVDAKNQVSRHLRANTAGERPDRPEIWSTKNRAPPLDSKPVTGLIGRPRRRTHGRFIGSRLS